MKKNEWNTVALVYQVRRQRCRMFKKKGFKSCYINERKHALKNEEKTQLYKWIFEASVMVVPLCQPLFESQKPGPLQLCYSTLSDFYTKALPNHIGKSNGKANVTTPHCSEMDHSEDWMCFLSKNSFFPRVGSTYLIFAPLIHLKIKCLLINVHILLHNRLNCAHS